MKYSVCENATRGDNFLQVFEMKSVKYQGTVLFPSN